MMILREDPDLLVNRPRDVSWDEAESKGQDKMSNL